MAALRDMRQDGFIPPHTGGMPLRFVLAGGVQGVGMVQVSSVGKKRMRTVLDLVPDDVAADALEY